MHPVLVPQYPDDTLCIGAVHLDARKAVVALRTRGRSFREHLTVCDQAPLQVFNPATGQLLAEHGCDAEQTESSCQACISKLKLLHPCPSPMQHGLLDIDFFRCIHRARVVADVMVTAVHYGSADAGFAVSCMFGEAPAK